MEKILQVQQFNHMIDTHLKALGEVVVEGEISELKINQGKWLFITIKDDRASLNVFAPVYEISTLNALEEGMKVHVYGRPNLHQKSSRFSLNAKQIIPAGEGALKLAYEKLKTKLMAEGLFDAARKRTIIKFPQKIGLITAKGSMAYSDFVKILSARMGGLKIYFYPVNVQGKNSVKSLLLAFKYLNSQQKKLNLDAIVLTRGGGSLEDLLSFNDEAVARAVFASKIPVISGIGHEEDIALTDLVADVRASTPSNAAELLVVSRQAIAAELRHLVLKLESSLEILLREAGEVIDYQVRILINFFEKQLSRFFSLLRKLRQALFIREKKLGLNKQALKSKTDKLLTLARGLLKEKIQELDNLERLLSNLDYRKVLKRGFSFSKDEKGQLVRSVTDLKKETMLSTYLVDGVFVSQIKKIDKN
ncbi:MAG: exodeoxyribonuclease VII large subunit [Candidatus Woesebacteria bacterium]|jgi:exodeoxyribonuclease VII large subunit